MIAVSHDPESGTLYWYFTEIIAGSTEGEGESDAVLLLDNDGQIVGLELELDSSVSPDDLTFALSHPQVRYNKSTYTLTIMIADVADPDAQPLSESAILDFDLVGMVQGVEVQPAKTFGLDTRLERLAPFLVDLDAEDDDEADDISDDDAEDDDDTDDSEFEDGEGFDDESGEDESDDDTDESDELAELDLLDEDVDEDELRELDTLDAEITPSDDEPRQPAALAVPTDPVPPADIRAGFVALVGKPNVGKSTLLNAILGEKIAITSPKPQTTRLPMRGILNRPGAQIIFVDTPGIHDPRTKLGTFMVDQARRAIPDADVICMVVDISEPPSRLDRKIAELMKRARAPKLLVLNKIDLRTPRGQQHLESYRALGTWDMELAVSATKNQGLETLINELVARLPTSGQLYPSDQMTDQNARERAAELVREQVLWLTEQEVPHSVAVEPEEWEDRGTAMYIRMSIYVEKISQKSILIGAKGAMLKQIGSRARTGIERMLGKPVYLDLWVKTRANWRDDPSSLRWLGYTDKS